MKTNRILRTALLAAAPAFAFAANDQPKENPRLQVTFLEAEKFTDVREDDMDFNTNVAKNGKLAGLRDYLNTRAVRSLPPGHRLEVTFTDIDLAGDFEPWRGPNWSHVRVVKEIYPPRMDLAFRLTDAEGNVVKEGRRELRDTAFMSKLTMGDRSDPLKHEKALIDEWLSSEFAKQR